MKKTDAGSEFAAINSDDVRGLPSSAARTAGTAGQVLALNAAKSGYELQTVTQGAGGLNQAAVDARVVAGVQPWARVPPTGRITEPFLPRKLDDFIDALSGTDGWQDLTTAAIASHRSTAWNANGYSQ